MSADSQPAAFRPWGDGVAEALEDLHAANEAFVARTEDWSRINSGSYEAVGLARMRDELANAFSVLPGALTIEALAPTGRIRADGESTPIEHGAAIRVRVRSEADVRVALTGHYDTVFPAAHAFQAPWREGDVLHGPGTADMKGGIVVMLAALAAFEKLPGARALGYEILLSPDEEIGSPASAPLLADLGARSHFGMTYEPAQADGGLVSSRKGSGNFHLVIRGRAAHVGRAFESGRNAVIAAAAVASSLDALNRQRDGVTFNVGAIDGGSAVNVVPDNAVLRFNVRSPDVEGVAWAEAEIQRIVAELSARDGFSAHLHGGVTRPPKPLNPPQQEIARWTSACGAALGKMLIFAPSGGVCEGNNLAAAGCPNIDTLGPAGGGLHTDGEFALIPSFAERAQLSLLLLAGAERGLFDVRSLKE